MPRMIHTSLLWQGPVLPCLGVCYLNLIKSCVVAAVAYDTFFLHVAGVYNVWPIIPNSYVNRD